MGELLKRTFFGLIYVLIVIASLQEYTTTALLLLIFLLIGLKEFSYLISIPYKTVLLPAILLFLYAYITNFTPAFQPAVLQISLAFLLLSLFMPLLFFIFEKISLSQLSGVYLALVYLAIPFALALFVPHKLLLAVFVIIWSSDTFAYLTGKYLGKHKLAEKISPKKTIEGFVGGLLGSLLVAFLFFRFLGIQGRDLIDFLLLAFVIVIFGTLGDLLESKFKRLAGVKDSGTLIPGHGGVLDRLDSFILAVPFVYIFIQLT